MHTANFCPSCGERLTLKGWRAWLGQRFCDHCSRRFGALTAFRSLIAIALVALAAFSFGRYLRPSPPPLIIQRAANSPLSDLPVNLDNSQREAGNIAKTSNASQQSPDDPVY